MSYQRGWEKVIVVGSEGLLVEVDNSVEMLAFKYGKPVAAHKPDFVAGSSEGHIEMGFVGELQAFVDAIASGVQPEANMESAAHTMAVLGAINRAVEENTLIDVEEF